MCRWSGASDQTSMSDSGSAPYGNSSGIGALRVVSLHAFRLTLCDWPPVLTATFTHRHCLYSPSQQVSCLSLWPTSCPKESSPSHSWPPKFGLSVWEGIDIYTGLPVDVVLSFKDSEEFSGKQRTRETLSTHAEYKYSFFPRSIPVNSYVWNTPPACAAVQAPYLGIVIVQAEARLCFPLG